MLKYYLTKNKYHEDKVSEKQTINYWNEMFIEQYKEIGKFLELNVFENF